MLTIEFMSLDKKRVIHMSVLDCYQLVETYEIEPMIWSKRKGYIEKLVV